jgi:hypothetical protein
MSPENQATDGGSEAPPEGANTTSGAEMNEPTGAPEKVEAAPTPAEPRRKPEPKAESKVKAKAKEEVQPAPVSTVSEPKTLAQLMKVDLRRRRRSRY